MFPLFAKEPGDHYLKRRNSYCFGVGRKFDFVDLFQACQSVHTLDFLFHMLHHYVEIDNNPVFAMQTVFLYPRIFFLWVSKPKILVVDNLRDIVSTFKHIFLHLIHSVLKTVNVVMNT